jgi:hypothetical protein
MFFVPNNKHGLANERVKWVGDHIMNSLRGKAA